MDGPRYGLSGATYGWVLVVVLDRVDPASSIGPMVPSCRRESESPGLGCFAMLEGRAGKGGEPLLSVGFVETDRGVAGDGESDESDVSGSAVVDDCGGGLKPSEIVAAARLKSSPSPALRDTLTELL